MNPEEYKACKKSISLFKRTKRQVLIFVMVNMNTAKLTLLTDESFPNERDLKSQIHFVVVLADHDGRSNILHYGRNRCRHATRSVMASDLQSLVFSFNFSHDMTHLLRELKGHIAPIESYMDSKAYFDVIPRMERRRCDVSRSISPL